MKCAMSSMFEICSVVVLSLFVLRARSESCTDCCDEPGNSNPQVDFLQLTLQNVKGFCQMKNCEPPKGAALWTIHGLWPSQKETMGPNGCNATAVYDQDAIESVMTGLQTNWPSLLGDNTGFWCHEWCKHGTCAVAGYVGGIDSELGYFQAALKLYDLMDVTGALDDIGVKPSSNSSYDLPDIFKAFRVQPILECSDYKNGQLLFQARFCFSKELVPVTCDSAWFSGTQLCNDNSPIYYL